MNQKGSCSIMMRSGEKTTCEAGKVNVVSYSLKGSSSFTNV